MGIFAGELRPYEPGDPITWERRCLLPIPKGDQAEFNRRIVGALGNLYLTTLKAGAEAYHDVEFRDALSALCDYCWPPEANVPPAPPDTTED